MSWPFTGRAQRELTAADLIAERTGRRTSSRLISRKAALRHSVAWSCLRLRADLISTMPVKVYRDIDGTRVKQFTPPILETPGGPRVRIMEWLYSSQFDLDSCGNTFGIITARDGAKRPSRIDLVDSDTVTVYQKNGQIGYRIGGTEYDPADIWHERQFTLAGCPVGLSPVAYAAMTLDRYLSAGEFAANWFSNSTLPGGHLKNTARVLKKGEAGKAKANFKASVEAGDVWVSGSDWEYNMIAAKASESQFIETMDGTERDVCRFFGVPADLADVVIQGSSLTYANIGQRNLQFLIMNLGPAIRRREDAFSADLLAAPRYVKFNADALLRMDTKSRYDAHKVAVDGRWLAPSEVREIEERPPFTPEQLAEFAQLFPNKAAAPTPAPEVTP